MKAINKTRLLILFCITIPLLILYLKWAAQDTLSLPGLPGSESESFFNIVQNNIDVIVLSLLGSIPVFYWSFFFLTPKLLFKINFIKIMLYTLGLVVYFLIVTLIAELIFPMYYFFGTPYAIKVLAPIILLSALGGTLFAYMNKLQTKDL
jgi:hypothetical protein